MHHVSQINLISSMMRVCARVRARRHACVREFS
jgi:hypothetical protein